MDLENKLAIITGAASGIGKAAAILFAQHGASLVLTDLDGDGLSSLKTELQSKRTKVAVVVGDISQAAMAQRVVETSRSFDPIHVLFNNAGMDLQAKIGDTREEEWDRIMNVNLKSMFLLSKAVLPFISHNGDASIINMSSAAALYPIAEHPAYIASKGGVIALTKAMALELAPAGIRVNCICPGAVSTPLLQSAFAGTSDSEGARNSVIARYPLARIAEPEEIAQAVLFLASAASSYITGAVIPVDGGRTMH